MNLSIIVPVKAHSERCDNKNFRAFADRASLFSIKLQQLVAAGISYRSITIASDDQEVLAHARADCCALDDSGHNATFAEALDFWLQNVDGDDVAIVHVTCPLFDDFLRLFDHWKRAKADGYDSLFVVRPYRHFLVDQAGRGVNFHPGPWHQTSQHLPTWYEMTCAAFVIRRDVALHCHYYIGLNPCLLVDHGPHVDIDTEEEFALAELLYSQKRKNGHPGDHQ